MASSRATTTTYVGGVVERAPTPALFKKMRMPYTEALLAALPNNRMPRPTRRCGDLGVSRRPTGRTVVGAALPLCEAWPTLESRRAEGHPKSRAPIGRFHPIENHCAGAGGTTTRHPFRIRCSKWTISSWNIRSAPGSCTRCPGRHRPRRNAGSGWRIRLRQVDARPCGRCSCAGQLRGGCCSNVRISHRDAG